MSTTTFRISGKKHPLPAAAGWTFERRPGGWILATSPTGERKRLALREVRGVTSASLSGVLYQGEIQAQQRGGAAGAGGSDADLIAQFPGKVRKLLVAVGAKVAEGDPLVLVEAMKMEFTVKAPFAGNVKKVCVTEGQQLSPGDRFIELGELEAANGGS